jgi:uncharacterized membrane protein (UPF0127 family)
MRITRLVDCMTRKVLADKVELAETFWRRFLGLMFRRNFRKGQALLFKLAKSGRYGVHMFFVRFPIDLLYLNQDFVVVDIRRELGPWRIHRPKVKANYIIELPTGTISRTRTKIGHKLALRKA